jgi:hypothetical protein
LNAGTSRTSNAFSTLLWPSLGWNKVPSQYAANTYHWIGGYDSSDGHFVQIGYSTDNNGNEFLFAWTDQANGALCENGASRNYGGQGCTASFATFGITDQSWTQFWIWQNNATDQLYIGSKLFMQRTAAANANLDSFWDTTEVSTVANYDMQSMITSGLGLGGFYDQFAYNNNGTWVNQSPLTAWSSQRDYPPDQYVSYGNYFGKSPCSPPGGPFGQSEPYGSGSGGYAAGSSNNQCVGYGATLPGS